MSIRNKYYRCGTISEAQWVQILNSTLCPKQMHDVIRVIYTFENHRLNASRIANILGTGHFILLNRLVGEWGKKLCRHFNLSGLPQRPNGAVRWWNIVFDGEDCYDTTAVHCDWIIKGEMLNAIEYLALYRKDRTGNDLNKITKAYRGTEGLLGGEAEYIAKCRINQGRLRQALLARGNGRCALCGMEISELLITSHIKPWRESSAEEKVDMNNALLFCPNHDSLFDKELISFADDGKIMISEEISSASMAKLNLNSSMRISMSETMKQYMEFHRDRFVMRKKR